MEEKEYKATMKKDVAVLTDKEDDVVSFFSMKDGVITIDQMNGDAENQTVILDKEKLFKILFALEEASIS